MRLKIIIVGLFLIVGIQAFSQNKVKKISATDFYLMINQSDDCIILDASPVKYYNRSRIEGAKSIAKSEMIKLALKNVDKESPIMVYCKYGDRSKVAAPKITKMGFKNVYELKDGLYMWKEKNYPLDKTKKSVKK